MVSILKKALIVTVFLLSISQTAHAASLYLSPSSGSYATGENFAVSVFVGTGESMNAAKGKISFPTEYLTVVAVTTANSIVDLWVQKPSFSNAGNFGNVSFEGVVLNPGFEGPAGRIADAIFRVKKQGFADVVFGEATILANDGLGTNITTTSGNAHFSLTAAQFLSAAPSVDTQKRVEAIEGRISEVENKISESVSASPIVIVQELKQELPSGILGVWEILPQWLQIGLIVIVALAVLILAFLIISFGALVFIWMWGFAWAKKGRFVDILLLIMRKSGRFLLRMIFFGGLAEREIEGDIRYSIPKISRVVHEARHAHSFRGLMNDYFGTIYRITKRLFTKNEEGWRDTDRTNQR